MSAFLMVPIKTLFVSGYNYSAKDICKGEEHISEHIEFQVKLSETSHNKFITGHELNGSVHGKINVFCINKESPLKLRADIYLPKNSNELIRDFFIRTFLDEKCYERILSIAMRGKLPKTISFSEQSALNEDDVINIKFQKVNFNFEM